jgi:hypothetical protein
VDVYGPEAVALVVAPPAHHVGGHAPGSRRSRGVPPASMDRRRPQ